MTREIATVNKKLALLMLFSCFTFVASSQTLPRESLRGLNGVFLYVHPVGKEVEAGGLSTQQVRKVAETLLFEAGIPVQNEPQPGNGSANLVVIIETVKNPQGVYVYEVEVSLLQEVHLARRQEPDSFPSQTWGTKAIGLTNGNRMDLIVEPLRAGIREFIKDYLSVNPKVQQKTKQ